MSIYYKGKKVSGGGGSSSGGEGGATDHRALSGRDAPEQHPIESIAGLADELLRVPAPAESLTNEDLEGILK